MLCECLSPLFVHKTKNDDSVEGALKEVRRSLLDADVNLKVTNRLVDAVKAKAVGMKLIDGESVDAFYKSSR